MLVFKLPGNKQKLVFTDSVFKTLNQYRQTTFSRKEAGGQFFARITPKLVIIAAATGPSRKDKRHRFGFIPNKSRLKQEILEYFEKGYHYIGDWHSHPQLIPKPSFLDLRSMKKCFRQSKHELDHFVLAIIGKDDVQKNMWVGAVNSKKVIKLNAEC